MAALACKTRISAAQAISAAPAIVRTPLGDVKGERAGGVRVFRGIPFAEPPVGNLRFRPPVQKAAWRGVRDATSYAAIAMQSGPRDLPTSEDCLYLNVWTPDGATPTSNLPVYVWIHGGGFTNGRSFSPVTDGAGFAREGVVVVSVAYRLGVFGFLDVSPLLGATYRESANNGLSDLIMALTWVKENISVFGGDANRVTVGGQSAGAKAVGLLMGTPDAHGLFHQAVSESGGAERVWDRKTMDDVARGFGATWGRAPELLKTVDAAQLTKAQETFLNHWPQHFPLRPEVGGALLPTLPVEAIAAGSMRAKRLLIGTNLEESASFIGPHPQHDATAADLETLTPERFATTFAKYRELYPGMSDERLRVRAVTAEEYWVPSVRAADACVQGGGEAWMYRFDLPEPAGQLQGYADHSEELAMAWGHSPAGADAAAILGREIHAAWLSFIKGSAPQAAGLPEWPAYSAHERRTMVLNAVSTVETKPMEQELRLWDHVL